MEMVKRVSFLNKLIEILDVKWEVSKTFGTKLKAVNSFWLCGCL